MNIGSLGWVNSATLAERDSHEGMWCRRYTINTFMYVCIYMYIYIYLYMHMSTTCLSFKIILNIYFFFYFLLFVLFTFYTASVFSREVVGKKLN